MSVLRLKIMDGCVTLPINEPVGLVAGWGRFPLVVAETLKQTGHRVYCAGIAGHADADLAKICDGYLPSGVGGLGRQLRFFRKHGVRKATLAGKIFKHKILYGRWGWLEHLPDWTTIRTFFPHFISGTRDRKDDSLLSAVCEGYARGGVELVPAVDLVPELIVKHGTLTQRGLSAAQQRDVAFGWKLAKEMGRLDVGQTVIVKGQAVIAVEAIEGTDECIRRAGELCPQGGFVVVKTAKPQQDRRFDMPTIGRQTLENIQAARGAVLAVEADQTIFLDRSDVLEFANRHGIVVVATTHADERAEKKAA